MHLFCRQRISLERYPVRLNHLAVILGAAKRKPGIHRTLLPSIWIPGSVFARPRMTQQPIVQTWSDNALAVMPHRRYRIH